MNIKTGNLIGMTLTAIVFVVMSAFVIFNSAMSAGASAPTGLPATVATSSAFTVGPDANTYIVGTTSPAFEARTMCAARIISTVGQPIQISFGSVSSTTLSQVKGHLQGASTTVAYDSGIYGCGYMTIRGINASTTIQITETR